MTNPADPAELRRRIAEISAQNDELVELQRETFVAQLEHIKNQETRAQAAEIRERARFAIFEKDNSPEGRRNWQRHQLAMTAMNGMVFDQPLADAQLNALVREAFRVADRMLALEHALVGWVERAELTSDEDSNPDPPETPRSGQPISGDDDEL